MITHNKRILAWEFPLPRTHTGVLLGNGTQGLMVWGVDTLNITVGRSGFWDHRGGKPFTTGTTFKELKRLLEARDEPGIRKLFGREDAPNGRPNRPYQLGCARLELTFPDGLKPRTAKLDLESASLRIVLENEAGRKAMVVVRQAIDRELAWVELSTDLQTKTRVKLVPTWEYVSEELTKVGIERPCLWEIPADPAHKVRTGGGVCQRLPEDPALALAWADCGERIVLATHLGTDAHEALEHAILTAEDHTLHADIPGAEARAQEYWRTYWAQVPNVELPDAELQHTLEYGLYKQAGLTTPCGVAASLQGPWMEEYQIPPWSNDYHFNINIQMIYWPALLTNRLEHFGPLWKLIEGWLPELREHAKNFFGVEKALMLPHAVDDRCRIVGAFWAGMIDHACTAWVAQMAWLHYRYSMDVTILREKAWPLLTGAFNGYWAMIEERSVNGKKQLTLPISVSPEYNGSDMQACGRDASFQLAALHFLAQTLPEAARILGETPDPRWERVRNELPMYTLLPAQNIKTDPQRFDGEEGRAGPRIALWEGKDLEVSHRHHSHLGAIYPFRTIDPFDAAHNTIVRNSLYWWTQRGMGNWSGWCFGWAAMLKARCNDADAAVAVLRWWRENYTNIGHGTLHDADHAGVTGLSPFPIARASTEPHRYKEIMQMDAGMGALTAILELLVQCRGPNGSEVHVLPKIPKQWKEFHFDNIRAEGAFTLGATVEAGRTVEVRVESHAGGKLTLFHGLGDAWSLDGEKRSGAKLELTMTKGLKVVLKRV